jgi:AcrR family transcriptional regulator
MASDTLPAGLRDRKKVATRQFIVDVALNLFEADGYDNVSVDRIADAANVSARTVYRYFPTKSAIVFDPQTEWMEVFRAVASHPLPDEAVFAHLRRISRAVAQFVSDHAVPVHRSYRIAQGSVELQALTMQWERDWRIAAATVARPLGRERAAVVGGVVMGMITATLSLWFQGKTKGNLVAMVDAGFDLLESGFTD